MYLKCVVNPKPPVVSYEWYKDGQIIGRNSDITIYKFGSSDIGRYQCLARLDNYIDISSNSTITPEQPTGKSLL